MTVLRNFSPRDWGLDIVGHTYIETGVGNGDSFACAESYVVKGVWFEKLYGIDVNREAIEKLVEKYQTSRTRFYLGSSIDMLPMIINRTVPTTFWLDAHFEDATHWSPKHGQCPLLEELRIILSYQWVYKPVILIDDYAAFMSKDNWWKQYNAGGRLDRAQWPTWGEIYDLMGGVSYKFNFLAADDGILYCW